MLQGDSGDFYYLQIIGFSIEYQGMIKSLVVFAAVLFLSVFMVGCSIINSGSVKSPQIEQPTQHANIDNTAELHDYQTDQADISSDDNKPSISESIDTEVPDVESVDVSEDESEGDYIKPTQTVPEESVTAKVGRTSTEPNVMETGSNMPEPGVFIYDKCADILNTYVNERGLVDYKNLRRKRLELKAVLNEFDKLDPKEYKSWPEPDKIAFWINVYNLQKLSVVTDNYPITPASRFHILYYWSPSSIRHIEAQITKHKFLVMDEEFTFSEIEKRFFRREFDDPRIFFAITDACLSSPPLRNEPYYGNKLDEQLENQTRKFLASPLAFKIDREEEKVYLSALFQLSSYGGEFIKKFATERKFKDQPGVTRAVLNFISNYVSRRDVSFLEVRNYNVVYMSYDWTINDGS